MSIQLPLQFPPEEIWLDVPGYEDYYQVSNMGRLRRIDNTRQTAGKILKLSTTHGYLNCGLSVRNIVRSHRVHKLVMLAFIGECPEGLQINHKNGNKADNRLENLEYCTPKENTRHAMDVIKTRRTRYGENSPRPKLTNDQVRMIRQLLEQGVMQKDIALMFGISQPNISAILHGKRWNQVD